MAQRRTIIEIGPFRRIVREYDAEGNLERIRAEPLSAPTPPPPPDPAPVAEEATRRRGFSLFGASRRRERVEPPAPSSIAEEAPPEPEPAVAEAPAPEPPVEAPSPPSRFNRFLRREVPPDPAPPAPDPVVEPAPVALLEAAMEELPVALEPYEEPDDASRPPTPEDFAPEPVLEEVAEIASETPPLPEPGPEFFEEEPPAAASVAAMPEPEPSFEIVSVERILPPPREEIPVIVTEAQPPAPAPETLPVGLEPYEEPAPEPPALPPPEPGAVPAAVEVAVEVEAAPLPPPPEPVPEPEPAPPVTVTAQPEPTPPRRLLEEVPDVDARVDAVLRARRDASRRRRRAPLPVPRFEPLRREPWEDRLDRVLREKSR